MLLDKFKVTHSTNLEETVSGIRSRSPYFSNIHATPVDGWRYNFNRVTLGSVRIGVSEVTSLSYKSDFSDDVVVTACFKGTETLSNGRETKSLSRMPSFSPLFPTTGSIKNARFYTVRVSAASLLDYLEQLELNVEPHSFIERHWLSPVENSPSFHSFIQYLLHHIDEVGTAIESEVKSLETLTYIHVARLLSSTERKTSLPGNAKAFQRAIDFINNNLADDISVLDVAKAAGVSIRSIQLLFRDHAQQTITQHITQKRLAEANDLLRKGASRSVQDVCLMVGIPSLSHFSRLYRQQYGETPSETLRQSK